PILSTSIIFRHNSQNHSISKNITTWNMSGFYSKRTQNVETISLSQPDSCTRLLSGCGIPWWLFRGLESDSELESFALVGHLSNESSNGYSKIRSVFQASKKMRITI
ncbi:hypothetical protein PanWU01x14_152390, partial [Parasponia andersonii]